MKVRLQDRVIKIPRPFTWRDIKTIVNIADNLLKEAEERLDENILNSEENYYKEVLRLFTDKRNEKENR